MAAEAENTELAPAAVAPVNGVVAGRLFIAGE